MDVDWSSLGNWALNQAVDFGKGYVGDKLNKGSTGSPGGNASKGKVVGGLTQAQRIQWLMGEMGTGPKYSYDPAGALLPVAGGAPIYGPGYSVPGGGYGPPPQVPPPISVPPPWPPYTGGQPMPPEGFSGFATTAPYSPASGEVMPQNGMSLYDRAKAAWDASQGGGALPAMFKQGAPSARAITMIEGRNPITGKMHYWRHMGRPILFTGDIANVRRVKRARARLTRVCGGKR